MKLDRTRPFGDVFGDHPARYEQDGLFFNVADDQIDGEGNLIGEAPKAGKKQKVPAPVKEDSTAGEKPKASAPVKEDSTAGGEDQLSAQLLAPVAEFE